MIAVHLSVLAALLLGTSTAAAAVAGVTVVDQTQITGAATHPGDPSLPCTRPTGAVLACSRNDNGSYLLDLKPSVIAGQVIALVHPGARGREMRLLAVDAKGKRKELGRAVLKPGIWQSISAAIGELTDIDHIQLSSPGAEAFWLTGAAVRVDGEPRLADLELVPNPLLKIGYDGSQGVTQLARTLAAAPLPGSTLRVLMPGSGTPEEKSNGERVAAAIARGWNTAPPPNPPKPDQPNKPGDVPQTPELKVAADSVRWYANSAGFAVAMEKALADLPQLLVINLATVRNPALKPDDIAKLMTQASRAGVLVALILDERPDDPKLLRSWQQWVTVMHQASPALGIIDQQEVDDWYAQPGANAIAVNPLLGEAVDRTATLIIGFTDLRARYEWALYEARFEALPSENTLRRRGRMQR